MSRVLFVSASQDHWRLWGSHRNPHHGAGGLQRGGHLHPGQTGTGFNTQCTSLSPKTQPGLEFHKFSNLVIHIRKKLTIKVFGKCLDLKMIFIDSFSNIYLSCHIVFRVTVLSIFSKGH